LAGPELTMRKWFDEAKLWLIAVPVLIWTLFPLYHLFVLSISTQESMLDGRLWPKQPTLDNFDKVFGQKHYYLSHFWEQFLTSALVALAVGLLTLFIATSAAFAISRLRVQGGRALMNLALATYLIPAAFLAVPMYKTMGLYGLLDTRLALVLAMVALASPYAIWVLKQASDKLPRELDEAAIVDGATVPQLFRLVYLPMMKPPLVAIGIYALLLAWNEYLYAFLLISNEREVPLAVGLGNFLGADDSPWPLMMAAGLVYAIPPAVIYYTFRKYMVSGLTAGAVKA
jgi:multiple sugar transport system permease protein